MLRVNKDLAGREIMVWGMNRDDDGRVIASARFTDMQPVILNEASDPLRAGDRRPFFFGHNIGGDFVLKAEEPLFASGSETVAANFPAEPVGFAFIPIGYITSKSAPDVTFGGAELTRYIPPGEEWMFTESEFLRPERIKRLGYAIASTADGRLTTEPFSVGLQFYRMVIDKDGQFPGEPVLYKELTFGELAFDGEMLLRGSILWDGLGDDGTPLPKGDYLVEVVFPDEVHYRLDGGPILSAQFYRGIASGTSGYYPLSIRDFDVTPYGSGDTEVLLAPTRVRFLFDDARTDISVVPDGILYLENRTYVPLRLFAESMGEDVSWTPPAETGTGRGRVEIGNIPPRAAASHR
jgi:hypothetical protein